MKIFYDKDLAVNLEKPTENNELKAAAPVVQLLNSRFYFKEIENHTSCAKAVCQFLSKTETIKTVIDFMCGIGLIDKLILKYINPCIFYFPGVTICN